MCGKVGKALRKIHAIMKVKLNLQLRLPENDGARLMGHPLKETAHVE